MLFTLELLRELLILFHFNKYILRLFYILEDQILTEHLYLKLFYSLTFFKLYRNINNKKCLIYVNKTNTFKFIYIL